MTSRDDGIDVFLLVFSRIRCSSEKKTSQISRNINNLSIRSGKIYAPDAYLLSFDIRKINVIVKSHLMFDDKVVDQLSEIDGTMKLVISSQLSNSTIDKVPCDSWSALSDSYLSGCSRICRKLTSPIKLRRQYEILIGKSFWF